MIKHKIILIFLSIFCISCGGGTSTDTPNPDDDFLLDDDFVMTDNQEIADDDSLEDDLIINTSDKTSDQSQILNIQILISFHIQKIINMQKAIIKQFFH